MTTLLANIAVQHQVWGDTGTKDSHNRTIYTHGPIIKRMAIAIYPLHRIARRDPTTVEYEARTETDLLVDVPDATVYHKNDRVLLKGTAYLVQNEPRNHGGDDPFGFDKTLFGGTVHLKRVT